MNKKIITVLLGAGLLLTACGNEKVPVVEKKPVAADPSLIVTINEDSTPAEALATIGKEVTVTYFSGFGKKTNYATLANFNSVSCDETGVQFKNYPAYEMAPLGIDTKAYEFLAKYVSLNYQKSGTDYYVRDTMSKGAEFVKNNTFTGKMLPYFSDLESIYGVRAPSLCNILNGLPSKLENKMTPFDDTVNFEDKATISKLLSDPKSLAKGYVVSFDKLKNTGTKLEGAKSMFWLNKDTKSSNVLGGVVIYDKDGKTIASFMSISTLPKKLDSAI